jgi:hypothetical protein
MQNPFAPPLEVMRVRARELIERIRSQVGLPRRTMLRPEAEEQAEFEANPPPLVEQIAENMAICAGVLDEAQFISQAEQLLRSFEAIEGRSPADYLEIEDWSRSHLAQGGRFLVVK